MDNKKKRISSSDYNKALNKLNIQQQALNNVVHKLNLNKYDWTAQQQTLNDVVHKLNLNKYDWTAQQQALNTVIHNWTSYDWNTNFNSINKALKRLKTSDWLSQLKPYKTGYNKLQDYSFDNIYKRLLEIDTNEISEIIDIYSSTNEKFINKNEYPPTDDRTEKKRSLQDFVSDLVTSLGVDIAKYFIITILLPYLNQLQSWIYQNHEEIIHSLQQTFDQNPLYLVGYAGAKKIIKDKNLSTYAHVNLIGFIRKSSLLREGSSHKSRPVKDDLIKAGTFVTIISRKKNWVKVRISNDTEQIEGWLEKSVVVKFQRKK